MTRAGLTVQSLELRFKRSDGSAITTFSGANTVQQLSYEIGVGAVVSQASAELVGEFSIGGDLAFQAGTIVEVYIDHTLTSGLTQVAVLRVVDVGISARVDGRTVQVSLELENWLFGVLRDRLVTQRFEDTSVSTAVNRLLSAAPDSVSLANNLSDDPNRTRTFDAVPLHKAIISTVGDGARVYADGRTLRIDPLPTTTAGTLTLSDLQVPELTRTVDGLASRVRVDGGDISVSVSDVATETAAVVELEPNSRLIAPIMAGVSEYDRVGLFTNHDGADGELVVRLQAAVGDGPAAPNDPNRDIARRALTADFVSTGGTTDFVFPEHDIPTQTVFILVEQQTDAVSPVPYQIGVTTEGEVAIASASARRPLVIEVSDEETRSTYGRRDVRIQDDSIGSFTEARDRALAVLRRRGSPSEELRAGVHSTTGFNLSLLDPYEVNIDQLSITEPFIVTDVSTTIEQRTLTREVTLAQPAGFP